MNALVDALLACNSLELEYVVCVPFPRLSVLLTAGVALMLFIFPRVLSVILARLK